jgi:altronate dehydratase
MQPLQLHRQQLEEQLAREQAAHQEMHRRQVQEAQDQHQAQRHAEDNATANQHRLAKEVQSFQQMQIGLHMRERCTYQTAADKPSVHAVASVLIAKQRVLKYSMQAHNC